MIAVEVEPDTQIDQEFRVSVQDRIQEGPEFFALPRRPRQRTVQGIEKTRQKREQPSQQRGINEGEPCQHTDQKPSIGQVIRRESPVYELGNNSALEDLVITRFDRRSLEHKTLQAMESVDEKADKNRYSK